MVRAAVLLAGGGDRATTGSCGAFSGGLMALSARYSPHSEEPSEQEMATFNRYRPKLHEFRDWFMAEFGGVTCKEVQLTQLGRVFNFMDFQELKAFAEGPGIREKCAQVYMKAALKIAEMLSREDCGQG